MLIPLQDLANMDVDDIMAKQVEQLEKEKKELQERLRNQEKKVTVFAHYSITAAVKHVLSGHSKIDKTKILMTSVSLMKVKVLQNAPIGAFCNTFDLH